MTTDPALRGTRGPTGRAREILGSVLTVVSSDEESQFGLGGLRQKRPKRLALGVEPLERQASVPGGAQNGLAGAEPGCDEEDAETRPPGVGPVSPTEVSLDSGLSTFGNREQDREVHSVVYSCALGSGVGNA